MQIEGAHTCQTHQSESEKLFWLMRCIYLLLSIFMSVFLCLPPLCGTHDVSTNTGHNPVGSTVIYLIYLIVWWLGQDWSMQLALMSIIMLCGITDTGMYMDPTTHLAVNTVGSQKQTWRRHDSRLHTRVISGRGSRGTQRYFPRCAGVQIRTTHLA